MNLPALLLLTALITAISGAILATARYFAGDRLAHLRRCTSCWYSMEDVPGTTCPECGQAHKAEHDLHKSRRRRPALFLALVLLLAPVGGIVVFFGTRFGWESLIPDSVATWALEAFVSPIEPPSGADIPQPPPAPTADRHITVRLAWQQRYVLVIRAWGDVVASPDAAITLADFARIHRALGAMAAWDTQFRSTSSNEWWLAPAEIFRQRQRIELLEDRRITLVGPDARPVPLDRMRLFMLAFEPPPGTMPAWYQRSVPPPHAYVAAMGAADAAARPYALQRLTGERANDVDVLALIAHLESLDQAPAPPTFPAPTPLPR